MALVGPRPTSFAASTYALWQTERLAFRPGLTGPWQVWGRRSMDFADRAARDRVLPPGDAARRSSDPRSDRPGGAARDGDRVSATRSADGAGRRRWGRLCTSGYRGTGIPVWRSVLRGVRAHVQLEMKPLGGREPELRRARGVTRRAGRRSARMLQVAGQPGIGKSRLLDGCRRRPGSRSPRAVGPGGRVRGRVAVRRVRRRAGRLAASRQTATASTR